MTRREAVGLLAAAACTAADNSLVEKWKTIAAGFDGVVGASALHLGNGRTASLRGGERFPMASVCKLPIAMQILALSSEGRWRLDEEIEIPVYDVVPYVSPIAERWPKQKRFRLDEMVRLMVAQSDNTAVQTLFRMAGSGEGMAARLRQWKIEGMRLDRSERQAGLDAAGVKNVPPVEQWTPDIGDKLTAKIPPAERKAAMRRFMADPRDTATPDATVNLLRRLFGGEVLSRELTERMIEILKATTTGPARLKGLLPEGTVVAHKTGTTGSAGTLNGSTNDAGVIYLPGGGQVAIAVFVKGSERPVAARERVIAQVAKAAYEWAG